MLDILYERLEYENDTTTHYLATGIQIHTRLEKRKQ